jgi:NitT/TauT family transport system substrate-binding protein
MDLESIEFVPLSQLDMPRAFAAGEIDAAVTYPPSSSHILREEGAHVIFDSSRIPATIVDILIAEPEFIEARQASLIKLLQAYERARRYNEQEPDRAAAIMAAHTGVSAEELRQGLAGLQIVPGDEQGRYFAAGGPLTRSIAHTVQVLNDTAALTPAQSEAAKSSVVAPLNDSVVRGAFGP